MLPKPANQVLPEPVAAAPAAGASASSDASEKPSNGEVVVTIAPSVEPEDKPQAQQEDKPQAPKDPLLAAIEALPKKIGEEVKEPKKPKPIPSGIKPRGFILPALVTLVMCIPICALVLPVGLTSRRQINKNDKDYVYLCVTEPVKPPPNSTAAQTRAFWQTYLTQLNKNCSEAAPQVWQGQQPGPGHFNVTQTLRRGWMMMDVSLTAVDPLLLVAQANADVRFNYKPANVDTPQDPFADDYSYEYLVNALELLAAHDDYYGDYYDYTPPPPGAAPPGKVGGGSPATEPPAADYPYPYEPPTPAPIAKQPPTSATPARSPAPAVRPPAAGRRRAQSAQAARRRAAAEAGKAPTARRRAAERLTPAEVLQQQSKIKKIHAGALVDQKKKLMIPSATNLEVLFMSSTGSDAILKAGDRTVQKQLKINMESVNAVFNYPFDNYKIPIKTSSHVGNDSLSYSTVPMFVRINLFIPGWKVTVQQHTGWSDQYIDDNWTTFLNFDIAVRRTGFIRFFAVLILTGMWLLTSCAIAYAMDLIYFRPRNATIGDAGLFTGLLFAMNGIRGVMPGVPPVGQAVDFFGFIWLMMFMMMTAAQVYAKVIGQYIHDQPTVYDKVAKTKAFKEWKKKEDERKKKEEEKKKSEGEKKKKEGEKPDGEKPDEDSAAAAKGEKAV